MDTRETAVVPATTAGMRRATEAFEAFCLAHAVPAPARRRVLVALDEVLSNTIRHGRPQGPGAGEATVSMSLAIRADVVLVELVDSAAAFNPLLAPPPDTTAPLEARTPGGLGIALVRAMMDDVHYERRDGHNVLTLTARLSKPDAGDPHADS
jgi:serine/threonine-protein kinase RsbW